MSIALYRKYRPLTFGELVGQEAVKITLKNQVGNGQIAHAYLFSGPRGIGKTSTARILARAVNCKHQKNGEPDNTCDFCKDILDGRSLDVMEIDAASNTGVDHVRDHIIENSRFTPQRLAYKVFIIDEVHMLSISAFNALLKTLEEPPSHVLFILATTEIHRVPETIISRCQRFDFKRIGIGDLVGRLQDIAARENIEVDEDVARAIARKANGSSRDGEVLLAQVIALGEKHITQEHADLILPRSDIASQVALVESVFTGNMSTALEILNRLAESGTNMHELSTDLIELIRKMLVAKVSGGLSELERGELDDDAFTRVQSLARDVSVTDIAELIDTILEKRTSIRSAPLPQIPLELAFVMYMEKRGSGVTPIRASKPIVSTPVASTPAPKKTKPITPVVPAPDVKPAPLESTSRNKVPTVALERILEAWPRMLEDVHKHHRGVYLVLRAGRPVHVQGQTLTLGFPFKLLAEQVATPRIQAVLADVFTTHLSASFAVLARVASAEELVDISLAETPASSEKNDGNPVWNSLAESFGGEVVPEE
ncbi:MAG: DNA polymerase III subunit gamma/tau [Patescibacteria group bacterium]|jgi:DNA polymerase-3 subunit gamma/tau